MGIILLPVLLFTVIYGVWGCVTFIQDSIKSNFKLRYIIVGLSVAFIAAALATTVVVATYYDAGKAYRFDVIFSVMIGKPACMLAFAHYSLRLYARSEVKYSETIRAFAYGFRLASPILVCLFYFFMEYVFQKSFGINLYY